MGKNRKLGFTLIEVAASVTLFVLVMALAMGGYLFSMKNVNQGDVQNELDIDVQLAMERLKTDLRLSSLDAIFYHPAGAGPYKALSFPLAHDTDGDGVLECDSDGNLLWDETVIYHVRPTTPNQLVRTTFKPRDNTLTDAQRQAQLEHVVQFGYGNSTYNGQNATSDVIFENLLKWNINAEQGQFDAYSSNLTRDSSILGYILLDAGTHEVTFTVADKNDRSSGYKIGVDQLFVSPSCSPREGEAQLPASKQSGGTASSQYMSGGDWKGNHQLYFTASGVGSTFTLNIGNDRWEETNFGAVGYEAENTDIIFDESLSPADFIVQLDGNDTTWDASMQTGSEPTDPIPGEMQNWCVRVMQKGSELADNGNWFDYNGRKCRLNFKAGNTGNLKITNVYIGESSSTTNATLDYNAATITPVSFGGSADSPTAAPGGSILSDWIDFPIDKEKNYLVSFRLANNATDCHPAIWPDSRGSLAATSMVVTNGTGATAKDTTWSGAGVNPMEVAGVIGLDTVVASYPAEGTYTSQIFDTHLAAPRYNNISWNAEMPSGTALTMKVRSGNQPDLSDASDWSTLSPSSVNPRSVSASYKRYVQFQAALTSDADGLYTPALKDVTIDWAGERQLVNVGGIFTKGPDYGIFNISVDGEPLRSALIVDLEIFKRVRVLNDKTRRLTSSLQADLTPRNTGM